MDKFEEFNSLLYKGRFYDDFKLHGSKIVFNFLSMFL